MSKDNKYETKRWSDPVITALATQVGKLTQSVDMNTKFINEKMTDFKEHCKDTCITIKTELAKINGKAEKKDLDKVKHTVTKHNIFWGIAIFIFSAIIYAVINVYAKLLVK